MDTKTIRPIFIHTLKSMLILALLFSVSTVAYAATQSPFVGQWQAIDVDGSEMILAIGGRPGGPFQITMVDNYVSFCDGEPGIVRGTGWLNEADPDLLEADLHLECFTTGDTLDFQVTFRYHPSTNKLSIRYSFGQVTIWHKSGKPQAAPPTLNLRVNYGHDWVESFYESGHMVWVTVTDGDGNIKATAELFTEPKWYWDGESGFQSLDSVWFDSEGNQMENPPDILPWDWVYSWVDNGASAQVQIGEISGEFDLEADSIQGTIDAPWFSSEVEVECHPWGAPKPVDIVTYGMVMPDNSDTYSCSWSGVWNILPNQDVGVGYFGPDGHWVANALFTSVPQIIASESGNWFWTSGFVPGTLDLAIYASADDSTPLWSGTAEADESGFTFVGEDVHGLDLVEGNYLVVSDSEQNSKGLVLRPISVTIFDTKYEFMDGIAPAGTEVWAAAGPQDWQERIMVDSDPVTGAWHADFAAIGFDITEDMQPWSYVHLYDGDGDANEGGVPPLELWVAYFTHDAGTWAPGEHRYHFEGTYSYPVPETIGPSPEVSISVSDGEPRYEGYVLLRPWALQARGEDGCLTLDPPALHPDQVTRFVFGWQTDYPMTYEEALLHFDSLTVTANWDDGDTAGLVQNEIVPAGSVDVCMFTANFILQADAGWVDSSLDVPEGMDVTITAYGEAITADLEQFPGAISGPDGQPYACSDFDGYSPCALDGAPYGALVGKIGEGGEPFFIGSNLTFSGNGDLYLAVNDNIGYYEDNAGSFWIYGP